MPIFNKASSDSSRPRVEVESTGHLRSIIESGATRLRDGSARHCTISAMPNIAVILKSEIARVARKEVRAETANLKKTASAYRSEMAALKRRVQALEQELQRLAKVKAK